MTVRYVGPGGNDSNSGLTWALRKLTLSGMEATPVVAGDFVWVGAGTYRELLTVAVSGTAGNPITYAADYTGANTDGVGGVVRITGSADDIALTRANCISASSKNYRTFQGFLMDGCSSNLITATTSCTGWIIDKCSLHASANAACVNYGGTGTGNTVSNCYATSTTTIIALMHSAAVDNSGHVVSNCVFIAGQQAAIGITRVGGATVKNCLFLGRTGIQILTALTVGQTTTVNNCIFHNVGNGVTATAVGEITEDYNNFIGNATARTNVSTGAHSLAYITMFDHRWFFNTTYKGAGPYNFFQIATPFDIGAGSPLINVAGTGATSTDMRGTLIQGAAREWGPLEYDSTLKTLGGLPKKRIEEMR